MQQPPKILVVGDVMLDHYLWGKCDRISPEAPVQVVNIQKEENLLGGAGNVVNNLLSLGAKVGLATVLSEDEGASVIEAMLKEKHVECVTLQKDPNRKTTKKSRIIALQQQIVRVDKEDISPIDEHYQTILLDAVSHAIQTYDMLILSDYAKGVLTVDLTPKLIALANRHRIPVLVDPKGKDFSKYRGATLLTPNKKEASESVGYAIEDDATLRSAGEALRTTLDLNSLMITLSDEGMAIFDADGFDKISTVSKEVYDVTGAGDTVLAALAYKLCENRDLKSAARFANAAAAVSVGKVGSATVTLEEIEAYEASLGKGSFQKKIKALASILESIRGLNRRIVFTNGCFDILHIGHVKYLEEAKKLGDLLIVGVNSDDSVRRLKGQNRPINTLEDRMGILAALESVDFVVAFEEDTPYELIRAIEPELLVKGSDYEGQEVIGSDIAKKTVLIEVVQSKSTTQIIQKVIQAC